MQQQVAWDKTLQADAKEAFAVLNNRLDQGFNSLNEVTNHFGARAKLETEYSNNFQSLLKSTAFKADQGTLKDALDKLIASSDTVSSLHVNFAKKLISDVDVPLGKFKSTQRALKKHHEAEIDKASKAAAKEVANVEKIKKDYQNKCNGMKQAVLVAAKGQTDKMTKKEYEKIQEKAIKAKKDVDLSELEYKNAVKKYDDVQDALDETLVVACREIQANENERYALIKSTLIQLIEAHVQMLSEQSAKAFQEALQAVKSVNADSDLNEWVHKASAGSTKTARLTFQSFFGEKKTLNRTASQKNIVTSPSAEVKIQDQIPKSPVVGNTARSQMGSTSNLAKSKVVNAEPEVEEIPAQAPVQAVDQLQVTQDFRPLSEATSVLSEASTLVQAEQKPRKLTVEIKPSEADRAEFLQPKVTEEVASKPQENLDSGIATSPEASSQNNVSAPAAVSAPVQVAAPIEKTAEPVIEKASVQKAELKSNNKIDVQKQSQPLVEPKVEVQPKVEANIEAVPVEQPKAEIKSESKSEPKSEVKQESKDEPASSTLKERTFTRRSIKMEGWLDVCDDSNKTWVKRWCALEGGYIWFFESQADNNKAQGQNKPKSMASVAKSTIVKGNSITGWQVPDVASKGDNLLTVVIGGKRQMLLACPDAEDCAYWLETIESVNKKK